MGSRPRIKCGASCAGTMVGCAVNYGHGLGCFVGGWWKKARGSDRLLSMTGVRLGSRPRERIKAGVGGLGCAGTTAVGYVVNYVRGLDASSAEVVEG